MKANIQTLIMVQKDVEQLRRDANCNDEHPKRRFVHQPSTSHKGFFEIVRYCSLLNKFSPDLLIVQK
jgi:hypothetical protein